MSRLHLTVNVRRIYSFLSGHNFRTSAKGKAWGWGGGGGWGRGEGGGGRGGRGLFFLPCGRWMSPTLLSDHGADLKQGHSHFPARGCPLSSPGGSIHLYLLLGEACSAGPPSLTLCGAAEGISWPPGVGVTTPAVQSANTAVCEQLKAAGVAVRDPPQDRER